MIKPRFKKIWGKLTVDFSTHVICPFPGKNPTRWVLCKIQNNRRIAKTILLYEGKPAIQVIELAIRISKIDNVITLFEFDRAGIFFMQNFAENRMEDYNYVDNYNIRRQYFPGIEWFKGRVRQMQRRNYRGIYV